MTWTLEAILRASIVLAAGLGAAAFLRYRRAALRHAMLAGAIFGSCLVPLGGLLPVTTVPVLTVPISIADAAQADVPAVRWPADVAAHSGAAPHLSRWTIVWFAGCLIVAGLLAVDLFRLRRIAAAAQPMGDARWLQCADDVRRAFGIRRRVPLLVTTTEDVLATSGFLRPRVLLPSTATSWPDERIRVVLCHELAHVRRGDWALQIGAEIVRAVYWFNPLTWMTCTRLRRESEHACDDVVVGSGVRPEDYAAHLLDIARTCRKPLRLGSAMTMARPSTLHRRIAVMLNSQIDHRPRAPRRLAWLGALAFSAAVSVVALQARQAGPATLTGTTYDPTGAVLPGVAVTLHDANGNDRTATTDAAGHFEIPDIAPGRYRLTTRLSGFHSLDTDFELKDAGDWDRAMTLQLGELHETITVSESRVGPPQPTETNPGQPLRVGGNIRPPLKLKDVRPVYPPDMHAAGREGVVTLEAVIRRDGTVGSVRVLSADVHPDFAIAAVDAVRQWRFSPTLLNAQPVEVVMDVSITFTLSE